MIIDIAVVETCGLFGAEVFDSVWVQHGANWSMFEADEDVAIDGVRAQRQLTTCQRREKGDQVCHGALHVPSDDAYLVAEADSRARVDEILSWVHVVPDLVAVPGYQDTNMEKQDDDAAEHYRQALRAAGFEVRTVEEKRPGLKAGMILGVEPAAGTVLEPGASVTVTEIAEPEGPADEVRVFVNSVGPGDSMDYRGREDDQIRAGTTLRLDLGGTVWVYGHGKYAGTLAGEIGGSALVLDDWKEGPNYGRSWQAVERGTGTITVTITAEGRRIEIGKVTVVVE